ncbi:hypothetical protein GCM10009557_65330 [Virgisporangium ochraceum]|uniref:Uncharacterized protein n=1 Tax=Virgisporangium ochraceum TaxID=65505 RepID=A0A8J4A0G3_9ACTN|nr:hypothetical protein Voc01_084460 [Virgisporangium ochraceum]
MEIIQANSSAGRQGSSMWSLVNASAIEPQTAATAQAATDTATDRVKGRRPASESVMTPPSVTLTVPPGGDIAPPRQAGSGWPGHSRGVAGSTPCARNAVTVSLPHRELVSR